MKNWYKKQMTVFFSEEAGMTLVELLASILLLSLIVTTFMSFFIQAGKTNNQIDNTNEATFIAQEAIELLTYYSKTKSLEESLRLIENENAQINSGFEVQSKVLKNPEDTLYTGTITVLKEGKIYAKMETRLSFDTGEEREN
ncbi:MAG: hypothetical protein KC455_03525 [Carnobacterium sp.]|uniref:hypothetical protein n=1 Tax=Carnobacterium sp. TMP28 TaxID=3397060 RepID=UPI001DD3248A|nr:hypothetical protein [Carnobacterium sp.]